MNSSNNKSYIKLENISKTYKGKLVLDIENFSIPLNHIISIFGNSGSGKSTLLNIITLLDNPDYEHYRTRKEPMITFQFDDNAIKISYDKLNNGTTELKAEIISNSGLSEKINGTTIRNQYFGYIFQDSFLHPNFNVSDNINTPLFICKSRIHNENIFDQLLHVFNMNEGIKEKYIEEISGGEEQRVAILRGLIKHNPIIVGDELTSNIDYPTAIKILSLIENKVDERSFSFLWVTHDIQLVHKFAEKIVTITNKQLEMIDNPKDKIKLLALLEKNDAPLIKLTEQSLIGFQSKNISNDIIAKLNLLKDKVYFKEEDFLIALEETIGKEETVNYKSIILKSVLIDNDIIENYKISDIDSFEMIRYYFSYAKNDLVKKKITPDFLFSWLSITFILLLLLSILKMGYATSKYLSIKLSDPRINYLTISASKYLLQGLTEKDIKEIKSAIGDEKLKYISSIYRENIGIQKYDSKNLTLNQYNAYTFDCGDPILNSIIDVNQQQFINSEENYVGIIIDKQLLKSHNYPENANTIDMDINTSKLTKIPALVTDKPLPYDCPLMIRKEFYFDTYGKNDEKSKMYAIAIYPNDVHDLPEITRKINKFKSGNVPKYQINKNSDVMNTYSVINQLESMIKSVSLYSICGILFLTIIFINMTVYKNINNKKSEIGVFLAFGMDNEFFYKFYLIEAMILSIISSITCFMVFHILLNPLFNNKIIERFGTTITDIDKKNLERFNIIVNKTDMNLHWGWELSLYCIVAIILVFMFYILIRKLIKNLPITLMKDIKDE